MKLREMFLNGLYTVNSEEVYNRFRELLGDDFDDDDETEYYPSYSYVGLTSDEGLRLVSYDDPDYYTEATYLTNEEFFAISLEEDVGISIENTAQAETQVEDSSKSITTNYPFKQFDYVDCSELSDEQLQAILDQMVECGATIFDKADKKSDLCNYLKWDADGDTYFDVGISARYQEVPTSGIFKEPLPNVTVKEVNDSAENLMIYPEALSEEEVCEQGDETVGSLLEQLQKIKTPNSPDITLDSEGQLTLFFLFSNSGSQINITGKSAEDIDRIYNAANVLMNV